MPVVQCEELVGVVAARVLLTVVSYRTNLTFRQVALLFGLSKSTMHRVVDRMVPLRYSVNTQVVIDANTRRGVAVGTTVPGNRHDGRAYCDSGVDQQRAGAHVRADGGYLGNREVIMPYRKPGKGRTLPDWREDLNTVHKRVRARVEHDHGQLTGDPPWCRSPPMFTSKPTQTHYGTTFTLFRDASARLDDLPAAAEPGWSW